MWQFSLIPHATPVNLVARRFRDAEILPSWTGLQTYAMTQSREIPYACLESYASREAHDPHRRQIHTQYEDPGAAVMWLGCEVFFYVTTDRPGLDNARAPANHTELPLWVLVLLAEQCESDVPLLRRRVDAYLATFSDKPRDPGVAVLRSINWPALPLHWRPRYFQLPLRLGSEECQRSQGILLDRVRPGANLEAASRLLRFLTGLSQ